MAEENEKRINIDDIPIAEEELTEEDAKNVAGGTSPGIGFLKSTDAGKQWAGNTVGGSLGPSSGNTVGGSFGNDPGRKMGDGSV